MKNLLTILVIAVMCASLHAQTQKDTVEVQGFFATQGREGTLNAAVKSAAGKLSSTVFKLAPYEIYVLNEFIEVPRGEHLEIVAPKPGTTQETAPPQIVWSASGGIATGIMFQCFGDITMKNVWLRYADVTGAQVGTTVSMEDNPDPNVQEKCTFEGVIFDYSQIPPNAAGAVTSVADHLVAKFTNCYFRNCMDPHFRYYGRALSFPFQSTEWHNDEVLFENCTFANMGYVYMQESPEYGDNVRFNHCTFLNIMMFTLQSGWWWKMSVTNSIFVNPFMFGYSPGQLGDGDPNGGTIRIDSVATFPFAVPFTEQDRRILFANNSHVVEPWLKDWMNRSPYADSLRRIRQTDLIPVPMPMLSPGTLEFFELQLNGQKAFPYMNKANLYDDADPGFVLAPTNLEALKTFLYFKWHNNFDINWAWNPESGLNQEWPLPEDLSYTNATLKTAAMGGFPLGDLYHWWPAEYAQWKAQEQAEHDRINAWLETGKDPLSTGVKERPGSAVPASFTLGQNYPNPFNPTTQIEYSVPRAGRVLLKVYNTFGQEVATLFDGVQEAGNYVATFDGAALASGVYLYQLRSGSVSITKKFVLMK
jgi:hypothetical protein